MKFLALLVLLGVSTILVSCQDTETDSADTSETAVSTDGNTGSETQADTTVEKQDGESSDSANQQSESTDYTNNDIEASEVDNKEETDDNNTLDDTSNQKEEDDNEDDDTIFIFRCYMFFGEKTLGYYSVMDGSASSTMVVLKQTRTTSI